MRPRGATSEVALEYPKGQAPQDAQPLTIRLDYGQPHLRGRTLHTDSLVPYGQPWRTGANAATTLQSDVDLAIGGVAVPRGTYLIYTLPSRTGWELILQRTAGEPPRPTIPLWTSPASRCSNASWRPRSRACRCG